MESNLPNIIDVFVFPMTSEVKRRGNRVKLNIDVFIIPYSYKRIEIYDCKFEGTVQKDKTGYEYTTTYSLN